MAGLTATIVADSISEQGDRLTTMVVSLPQSLLSRLGSYRALSRTVTPTHSTGLGTLVSGVLLDGFVPNSTSESDGFRESWLHARDNAVVGLLNSTIGRENLSTALRKNIDANRKTWGETPLNAELIASEIDAFTKSSDREFVNETLLLEPFMWTTCIISATNWDNLTALGSYMAEPGEQDTMQVLATAIRTALDDSEPKKLSAGEWHLPFLGEDELREVADGSVELKEKYILASVARCGGSSLQGDLAAETEFANTLLRSGYVSAWEHAATPTEQSWGVSIIEDGLPQWRGGASLVSNFNGWTQARKLVEGESVLNSVENLTFSL